MAVISSVVIVLAAPMLGMALTVSVVHVIILPAVEMGIATIVVLVIFMGIIIHLIFVHVLMVSIVLSRSISVLVTALSFKVSFHSACMTVWR